VGAPSTASLAVLLCLSLALLVPFTAFLPALFPGALPFGAPACPLGSRVFVKIGVIGIAGSLVVIARLLIIIAGGLTAVAVAFPIKVGGTPR
jgi:hypothetical protein